ncbi:MAG: radical SAM protein [Candidatus Pacebacteria bacterium]|nr:radical SAM protein [Candidatus Paceibacterota bacterium]
MFLREFKNKDSLVFDIFKIRETAFPNFFVKKIYKTLDLEEKFDIKIKNFPFCLLPNGKDHIFFEKEFQGIKNKKCRNCRYDKKCRGLDKRLLVVWGQEALKPLKDLPEEVMIEVESRCNLDCKFCYNKNSFAKKERIDNLDSDYIKKIINNICKSGIKIVRFTGGEPLLRKDILSLMSYAKNRGLEVRLNTNSLLINKDNAKKIADTVDNVLIPLEATSDKEEAEITGELDSFSRKIKAIRLLKKHKTKIVRAGTVATKKNIKDLEKFFKLVLDLKLDDWEVYRPIPTKDNKEFWSKKDVKILTDKLIKFREISGKTFFIANSVPFCSYDKNKVNSVSSGALPEDGHIRFAIDPRGFAKPHYYFNKNIGNPLDLMSCWNNQFMKKIRNLEFIPKKCKNCSFLEKCRSGSRYIAKVTNGIYKSKDPLMAV